MSAERRPGRPGFTLYFDWAAAIIRLGEKNPKQGIDFLKGVVDYAQSGDLPEDPFIECAISGYLYTIDADCVKYWKQVDGGFKGGVTSAENRRIAKELLSKNPETTRANPRASEAKTMQNSTPSGLTDIWVETRDGLRAFRSADLHSLQKVYPKIDIENYARAYADEVRHKGAPIPQGDGDLLIIGFRAWIETQEKTKAG